MFYTLNENKDNEDRELVVQNLEVSGYHWGSFKNIVIFADALELVLYGKPDFKTVEKKIIEIFLDLAKHNRQINEIRFYTDTKDNNTLVCVCVSNITTFKPKNLLQRNITINFKKQNKRIVLTDITQEETKGLALPDTWKLDEALTNTYNKYKQLFV